MSVVASEVHEILPGVFRWECFSREHKVELTSYAVLADGQLYIFDPIELIAEARQRLLANHPVTAIVLTNENHERATAGWREETQAPVWLGKGANVELSQVHRFPNEATQWGPWAVTPLAGGPGGEVALRWPERSLVVLGDVAFNLPKYGFGLLPDKYCEDQRRLGESLRRLTEQPFEAALFAHGAPILEGASARIRELVMN
jgi:glyoxylase-like metal-dependent hydrolase (beta-lactamase superfamily II)